MVRDHLLAHVVFICFVSRCFMFSIWTIAPGKKYAGGDHEIARMAFAKTYVPMNELLIIDRLIFKPLENSEKKRTCKIIT